jgi:transglutaminase-like putative cysteine protease
MQLLRKIIERISPSAKRKQSFNVVFSVTLTNQVTKQPSNSSFSLTVPLPKETKSQRILSAPIFSQEPTVKATESVHNNSFVSWNLTLAPGESKTLTQTFSIEKDFIHEEIPAHFTVADYKSEEAKKYLTPNNYIAGDNEQIKKIAREITKGSTSVKEIANLCNEYVIKTLSYGNPIPGLYESTDIISSLSSSSSSDQLTKQLSNQVTSYDCGGYDTLLISLLNASGVPARIVSGFWLRPLCDLPLVTCNLPASPDMHAWLAILLPDGKWIPADPSVEQLRRLGRSRKIGALGEVGSDRVEMSVGCDFDLQINNETVRIDILQTPIIHPQNPSISLSYSVSSFRLD